MDPMTLEAEDLLCDESFQRYCRGENKTDIQYWEEWCRNNPGKQPVVAAAKRLYDVLNLGQGNRVEQLTALKDAVARRSLFKEKVLNRQEITEAAPAKEIRLRSRTLLKYAAAIILLLTAGALIYIMNVRKAPAQLAVYEYHTGPQDHKTIMLPDSSVVMLNSNSHLVINKDFDAQHRQVTITGEAFFDVQHDAAHPFLVNTPQYAIRVLGTTFNVRSYPGKDTTETTLLTGKIEIVQNGNDKNEKPKIVLKPNQKFILAAAPITQGQSQQTIALQKGEVVKPVVDTATRHLVETSWTRNKMEINDKTLAEIAEKLQAWYGIKIRFADEAVKTYRYTATFDDETIFNALQYLQQSYPFTYTVEDDCIVIAKS